jgi:hypothetical protein
MIGRLVCKRVLGIRRFRGIRSPMKMGKEGSGTYGIYEYFKEHLL